MEKLSREDEAKRDLEHTEISRGVAWLLVVAFLLTLVSVPLVQRVYEIKQRTVEIDRTASDDIRPLFRDLPSAADLRDWENRLEDESVVAQAALPIVQSALVRFGAGNEQALLGRNGWLHYGPDVSYVTSRGFLDPALLKVRARSGDSADAAVSPDPLRAITQFRDDLAARGVKLIVLPTPLKTSIQPETLSSRFNAQSDAIQNRSWPEFLAKLRTANIDFFDAAPLLAERKRQSAQYLEADTHWTPDAMEAIARGLAEKIENENTLSPRNGKWNRGAQTVANIGDIALLLKLPRKQKEYPAQQVEIHPVTLENVLFSPQKNSEILLLGDSFSNMYSSRESFETEDSLGKNGWGANAGLAEQTSFFLQRPLDSITNNAGGSHVTRARLAGELKRNPARFAQLKVVVWQFAARDLLSGDWKAIRLGVPSNSTVQGKS
ncbi:MAG TPA: hypothetical protein VF681_07510 [Abditibacteriaceae bacterium]|jgi:alginate O-acetyltransferase complex protein AlgJ